MFNGETPKAFSLAKNKTDNIPMITTITEHSKREIQGIRVGKDKVLIICN